MKEIGISVERIPDDIFDNTKLIDDILEYFKKINRIDKNIINILIEEKMIEKWLIENSENIIQKLKDILDIGSRLKDIAKKDADEQFKRQLIIKILRETTFIDDAEDALSNIDYLGRFEVLIDYSVKVEELINELNILSGEISKLVDDFGFLEEEIKEKVKSSSHKDAQNIIEEMQSEYSKEKEGLINDIEMYLSVLRTYGDETLEGLEFNKKSLSELRELLEKIKKKVLGYLDEKGMRIFRFLKGEEDFPEDISIDDIKRVLECLRPIILKGLQEGSIDAWS